MTAFNNIDRRAADMVRSESELCPEALDAIAAILPRFAEALRGRKLDSRSGQRHDTLSFSTEVSSRIPI